MALKINLTDNAVITIKYDYSIKICDDLRKIYSHLY